MEVQGQGAAVQKLEKAPESDKLSLRQQLDMKLASGEFPKTIRQTEQAKHVPGVVWEAEKAAGNMKSVFYPEVDVQGLVDKYLGTGEADRSPHNVWTEFITLDYEVGEFHDKFQGCYLPTSCFAIRFSKRGLHAFPTNQLAN